MPIRHLKISIKAAAIAVILAINIAGVAAQEAAAPSCDPAANCPLQSASTLPQALSALTVPSMKAPDPPPAPATNRTVTYTTQASGQLSASLDQFKSLANQTLNDGRGWSRLGIRFVEVASGGQFNLILAEANQLPVFSSGCSALYSCAVGNSVIINQDRWLGATASWNQAGGSLRDYQHMVVNHEVGHWLGHGHSNCPSPGSPAPVMQQQSINLQGCQFNPWPINSELWSSKLGISL